MNETRNIIVGLDVGKNQSQICYYDRKEKEPISISVKAGSNLYEFPTLLSKKQGKDLWHCGAEAEFHVQNEGDTPVWGILGICGQGKSCEIEGTAYTPESLMKEYLEGCLGLLGIAEPVRQIKALMITVPLLSAQMVQVLRKAGEALGFSREQFYFQDYDESFYYYTMNHRKDNWSRRVGWFIFDTNQVSFAKLEMDTGKRPMLAQVIHGETVMLPEEADARDDAFHKLIEDSCRGDAYAGIYMVGPGFDQSWAVRSIPYLCRNQRHVFYGNNMYVKGACYGARERSREEILKGCQYLSPMMVKSSVSMEMYVNGAAKSCPLIEAGQLWYEVYTSLELILDEKKDLEFSVAPIDGRQKMRFSMKLDGLPERPNKATRIGLCLYYENEEQCVIEAKDLGFGELFAASKKVWTEKVKW